MSRARGRAAGVAGAVLAASTVVVGCFLATTRPAFPPLPGTPHAEVGLPIPEATARLAEGLRTATIPVSRVEPRDGYLETPWFDTATGRPVGGEPLGLEVVRVRGWVNPGRIGYSELRVETVFRRVIDPSLPPRELDLLVPDEHPTAVKVRKVLEDLARRYGGEPPRLVPAAGPPLPPDTAPAARDTARAPRDTVLPERVDSFEISEPRDTTEPSPRTGRG